MRIHTVLAVLVVLAGLPGAAQPASVGAVAETQVVVRGGNVALSLFLATDRDCREPGGRHRAGMDLGRVGAIFPVLPHRSHARDAVSGQASAAFGES